MRSRSASPSIRAARVVDPLNPVLLFTPPSEAALAAVATRRIRAGEPFAAYAGELVGADEPVARSNMYLYELDAAELAERGYAGGSAGGSASGSAGGSGGSAGDPDLLPGLRIDASRRGGLARLVNDGWTPRSLPPRAANCHVELTYDDEGRMPMLVFFADADVHAGAELVVDYGPDYWRVSLRQLRDAHADDAARSRARCDALEGWLAAEHAELHAGLSLPPVPGALPGRT